MKRLVIISVLMIAGMMQSYSQKDTTKGIVFEHGLSWREVLQKAKQENKYVFVDCYATWCGPCKGMEQTVYPVEAVGEAFNGNFISVKLQLDKTRQDDDNVRSWYQT